MFIGLDESFGKSHVLIGCICTPLDFLPTLEGEFIEKRIENNCWGELDWPSISEDYISKYKDLLKTYLSHKEVTFHSWGYEIPGPEFKEDRSKLIFKHEYILLKNTLIKCVNGGYKKFYILLDGGQSLKEYQLTKDYLEKQLVIKPKPEIIFYSSVDSKILATMQIVSICTSAVRYLYGNESSSKNKIVYDEIVSLLTELNGGVALNFNPKNPAWDLSRKFSHGLFDPLLKKPKFREEIIPNF